MSVEVSEAANTGRVRRLGTRLPPSARSAGAARDFVTEALRSWALPEGLVFDVVLASSELVTNAIEHGGGSIDVRLSVVDDRVVLQVRDEIGDAPVRKEPSLLSERSRGLSIVAALSVEWGHRSGADGRWIWAEFALSGAGGNAVAGGVLRGASASLSPDN